MKETTEPGHKRRCQWCSLEVDTEVRTCPECGASLAQRETIGDLVIPGVTHVDPALSQFADRPLRIPGASPSHSAAGSAVAAAAILGGPAGLAALGGLAAVAAAEYLAAGGGLAGRQAAIAKLGEPSEAVLQMLDRLEQAERTAADAELSGPETAPDAAPADEGTPPT